MSSNTLAYDESTGLQFTRPVQDGRTLEEYPFLQNGDTAARIYRRSLLVRRPYYVAPKPGTERDSAWEGGDPTAYNLPDSPLEPTGIGDLHRFTRAYARVPGTQYEYFADYIRKPTPAGSNSTAYEAWLVGQAGSAAVQMQSASLWLNPNGSTYPWHSTGKFFGPGANRGGVLTVATGGTFTLTYKTSTTAALNWNDSSATIAAAINALASVVADGFSVSVTNALGTAGSGSLTIAATGSIQAAFSMASSLTPSAASTIFPNYTGYTQQYFYIGVRYSITAHGYNTSKPLHCSYITSSVAYIHELPSGQWSAPDANTIAVNRGALKSSTSYGTLLIAPFIRDYQPGPVFVRYRFKTDFYLPGVTSGISTVDDIPTPSTADEDNSFLAAIVANSSSWTTYRADALSPWQGPIYGQRQQQIIPANVP